MKPAMSLLALGCALFVGASCVALSAMAQEKKPNVVFILADNVATATSAHTAAASFAARRRRASISWRTRACGSHSIWSNPPARPLARR